MQLKLKREYKNKKPIHILSSKNSLKGKETGNSSNKRRFVIGKFIRIKCKFDKQKKSATYPQKASRQVLKH